MTGDFITEGRVKIHKTASSHEGPGPGVKGKEAFYNTAMRLNRDISIMVLKNLPDGIRVLDAMGATGIRGLRYAKECGDKEIHISEITEKGVENIRKNAELNRVDVAIHHTDANIIMREIRFDFIDIDPFGTPIPFIDSGITGLKNGGILAITATDTAPLAGTYPAVCRRRYMAEPVHSYFGHESGLRILLGFVVRMGAIHDIAFTPLLSYYRDHYFRTFFRAERGAGRANRALVKLKYFTFDRKKAQWNFYDSSADAEKTEGKIYGPVWASSLGDSSFLDTISPMEDGQISSEAMELLRMLKEENEAPLFFHDVDVLSSIVRRSPPRRDSIFKAIPDAVRTHFSPLGFKTSMPVEELLDIFKNL